MFQINCPSCGTPVVFRRESSVYATCESCRSVLLRQDVNVKLIGKAADLQPDNTPLQVGCTGTYQGKSFEIVGRIQVHQENGYWNEWFLHISDGSEGWLGEACGEYFISKKVSVPRGNQLPNYQDLHINAKVHLGGHDFYVANLGKSVVSSYEGELPFIMTGSYDLPYADLRTTGTKAATLDYSEGTPLLFVGSYVEPEDLHFTNLRDPEDNIQQRSTANTSSLKCPCCGASHELSSAGAISQTLVCEYCGAGLDISNSEKHKILWESQQAKKKVQPLIKLGTIGEYEGVKWEVIGFQRKYSVYESTKYFWDEYLCYDQLHGYRYLCNSKNHWSWTKTIHSIPHGKISSNSKPLTLQDEHYYNGKCYKHFEGYVGYVEYVIGEFPYKVDLTTKTDIQDYVCPPYGLSRESSLGPDKEVYWSIAKYMEPDEVAKAFNITSEMEKPTGLGSLQVNAHYGKFTHTLILSFLTALAALLFCILHSSGQSTVFTKSCILYAHKEPSVTTEPFKITGSHSKPIQLNFNADLNNRWVFFTVSLINQDTNEAIVTSKSLSYYSGSDGGEYWSEGEKSGYIIVPRVAPGDYVLFIDPQTGTGNDPEKIGPPADKKNAKIDDKPLVKYTVSVVDSPTYWTWFFLICLILGIMPCWYIARYYFSEQDRWEDSDHPWASYDYDDVDDDDD